MQFYNILFFFIMISGFFSVSFDFESKNLQLKTKGNVILPLALLCFLQGIRALDVGNDTYKYARFFLHADSPGSFRYSVRSDPVYYFWCRVIRFFTNNTMIFNFCCALFIFVLLGIFIICYSYDRMVSIGLFLTLGLFFASMNQTRQTMAAMVILIAFIFAEKKNAIIASLICIVAILIHTTAIVFLPIFLFIALYPVIDRKIIILFTAVSTIAVIFFNQFIYLFTWFFPVYKRYIRGVLFRTRAASIWRYGDCALFVCVQIGLLLCIKVLTNKYSKWHNEVIDGLEKKLRLASVYACINAIAMAMSFISIRIAAMERIKQYFMYWLLICIPFCINILFKRKRMIGIVVTIISMIYMWHLGVRDGHGVIPFHTAYEDTFGWWK